MIMNEQMKNNYYGENYQMVMNLAQSMMVGGGSGRMLARLNEQREQETKNKMRKADANKMDFTPKQDVAVFELAIRSFDIQSGWRDIFERQPTYMRRDLFLGKLNPEKCRQGLQDMSKNVDYPN
jgi:hypothetical protein